MRGVLAALTVLLLGCSTPPTYFPLQPGLTWEYAVTIQPSDSEGANLAAPRRLTSTMRSLPRRQFEGRWVAPQSIEMGGVFSTVYRVEDAAGVHDVAMQAPGEDEPRPTPGRTVLRYPLIAGRSWDDVGEALFLAGGSAELPGEARISAVDVTATVPAGTYRHCLELQFTARGEVQRPGRQDLTPMRIDATFWYAPGVGLVKYVQRDRSPDGSGLFVAELTAFRRD